MAFGPGIKTREEKRQAAQLVMDEYVKGIVAERLRTMRATKGCTWCEHCRQTVFYERLRPVYDWQAKGGNDGMLQERGPVSPRHIKLVCKLCGGEIDSGPEHMRPWLAIK